MVTSSGSVGAQVAKARSTRSTSAGPNTIAPPKNSGSGTRSNSSAVAMPNRPWPPRTAQKSSGSVWAVTLRIRPSAVTSSTAVTWSAANPCRRARCPIPPPRL